MAHEITHCLLADYDPKRAGEHGFWHNIITTFAEVYLWETNEIKILAQLAAGSNKSQYLSY